jgi:hypothetical protein
LSSALTPSAEADAAELAADALAEAAALLALDADALSVAEALEAEFPEAALELDEPPHAASPMQHAHSKAATNIARCFFMMLPFPVLLPQQNLFLQTR